MALHQDADHAVFDGPARDVIVKGVGFLDLDFDFVAGATGHVDENGPRSGSFGAVEHVDRSWAERKIALDNDAGIQRHPAAGLAGFRHFRVLIGDFGLGHQRAIELFGADGVDDLAHLEELRFDAGGHLGGGGPGGKRKAESNETERQIFSHARDGTSAMRWTQRIWAIRRVKGFPGEAVLL